MSRTFTTSDAGITGAPTAAASGRTRALLACGVVAGPLFAILASVQVRTREGFDLGRHPLSLLSVGRLGWIQIANFVVTGVLSVAFAVGLRRVLHPGRGGTWAPLLVGLYGLGLVAGGVFVADPGLGFPPGTPEGIPDRLSWHGMLHAFAPPLAFLSLIVACFVLVRRFAALGRRGWAAYSAATGMACLALTAWPGQDGMSVRLAVAMAFGLAWISGLAAWLLTGRSQGGEPT